MHQTNPGPLQLVSDEGHVLLKEQETSLEHSGTLCLRYFQAIAFSRSANRTAALVSCSAVAVARAAVV